MEKDIVPQLLELINKEFDAKTSNSTVIKKAIKALYAKKATYENTNEFSIEVGEILAEILGKNITAETLPNGKMYFNIADRILNPTMNKNYEIISGYTKVIPKNIIRKIPDPITVGEAFVKGEKGIWVDGKIYESTLDKHNTWTPTDYPQAWKLVE